MAASVQRSRGLVALFKRGWNEIPEIIGSSFMALIGFGMGGVGLYKYHVNNGQNKRYKFEYTVYRHDDPRAATIKRG